MKFKYLNVALASLILSATFLASTATAGIISVDDWWLQTDANGGLRQNTTVSDIYFAVSKQTTFNAIDTYEAIDGYRFLSTLEAVNLWGYQTLNNPGTSDYLTYNNQGGWAGYVWEGANRYQFVFSDSITTGAMMHAGHYETFVYNNGNFDTSTNNFAGFVMIKDDTQTNSVPEPSTLAIFALGMIGLASRRFKKQS